MSVGPVILPGYRSGAARRPACAGLCRVRCQPLDVDDLVALAVALDVSPNLFLLSDRDAALLDVDERGALVLTPNRRVLWRQAWEWATGEQPLPPHAESRVDPLRFRVVNRPHTPDLVEILGEEAVIENEDGDPTHVAVTLRWTSPGTGHGATGWRRLWQEGARLASRLAETAQRIASEEFNDGEH
jgi:hypothetical protein